MLRCDIYLTGCNNPCVLFFRPIRRIHCGLSKDLKCSIFLTGTLILSAKIIKNINVKLKQKTSKCKNISFKTIRIF